MCGIISMGMSAYLNQLMNYNEIWYEHSVTRGVFTFVLPNFLQLVIQILGLGEVLIHDGEEKRNIHQINQIVFFFFQFCICSHSLQCRL
jgi:hypothetical protein